MAAADKRSSAEGWLRLALSRRVIRIALRTSAVVGSVLNAINQGPALMEDWRRVPAWAVLLNYAVPYLVATYGAISFAREAQRVRLAREEDDS